MDSYLYNKRLNTPIYTGTMPEIRKQQKTAGTTSSQEGQSSFQELLEQKVKEGSQIEFSKHALQRLAQRNVDVSRASMERLNEGVKMAQDKGLNEPLILVDSTAYVVNVKNNKVITVVNDDKLKGTVFTNIDGTVMI